MKKEEKRKNQKRFGMALGLIVAFILWTIAVQYIDVGAVGLNGSKVGFATINTFVHKLTGVHMLLYTITDWLGIIPLVFVLGFAILGLVQWIGRKSLWKVDRSILVLGVFYILVMVAYVFFEIVVINYRPVLIEGFLEASYPSSTTMLAMCVMPTAMMQLDARIKNQNIKKLILDIIIAFTAFMVIGRMISGVHWFTDIVGGILLSSGLVLLYATVSEFIEKKQSV